MATFTKFEKFERVKVWSNSRQEWLDGVVAEAPQTDCVLEGFSVPAGALKVCFLENEKWIMPDAVASQIKKVEGGYASDAAAIAPVDTTPKAAGETAASGGYAAPSASAAPAAPAAPALCKNGCGRPVQPGLTKGLRPFDTCCKRCAVGAGGHDANCGGGRSTTKRPTRQTLAGAELAVLDVKGTLTKWLCDTAPDLSRHIDGRLKALKIEGEQLNKEQVAGLVRALCSLWNEDMALTEDQVQHLLANPKYGGGAGALPRSKLEPMCRDLLMGNYRKWFPEVLNVDTERFVQKNTRPLEDVYKIGKKLGEGSFGSVYSAEHKICNEVRVCKKISLNKDALPMDEIMQEIHNMAKLDHPNVIKVYEYFIDAKFVSQIIEPCNGGELQDRIDAVFRHKTEPQYDEGFMVDVIKQVLRALAFMHNLRFAHKDLKPQNIMLTEKGGRSVKVIDFGLAEMFNPKQDVASFVGGTLLYMSPGCFAGRMEFKDDIWSAGVVLYNMINGCMPFCAQWPPPPGKDQSWWETETIKMIIDQPPKAHPSIDQVTPECKDVLMQMLTKRIEDRPDAAKCLEHPWFRAGTAENPTLSVGVMQCIDCYSRLSELKKSIFLLMAHQNSAPSLQELRSIFTYFDTNNEGTLSARDLRAVLADSGMKPLAADRVIHALDRDSNGTIGWTEFIAAAICVSVCKNTALVDAAFAHFDADSTGSIDASDFERVLASSDEDRQRWKKQLPELLRDVVPGADSSAPLTVSRQQFRDYIGQQLKIESGQVFYAVT